MLGWIYYVDDKFASKTLLENLTAAEALYRKYGDHDHEFIRVRATFEDCLEFEKLQAGIWTTAKRDFFSK
jgi:hypothetical protein